MLPSRGLRIFRNGRPRVGLDPSRQFSSSIIHSKSRTASILSHTPLKTSNLRPRILQTAPIVLNGTILRFQSTIPPPLPKETAAIPPAPTSTPEIEVPQEPAFEFDAWSNVDVTEHIGYLKSVGLDFGWGPTAVMEWVLEHIHVLAGTPWWASIALTAILIRVVMFKFFKDAANNAAKMARIKHLMDPLRKQMLSASKGGTMTQESAMARSQLKALTARHGIKAWQGFTPMFQAPLGYGMWKLLNAMAALPVPGFENGGVLWFSNLALSDPLYILPLVTSGVLYLVLRRGGETGVQLMSANTLTLMSIGLPILSFVFTSNFSAGTQLYFLVTGILSGTQAYLFSHPGFRTWAGMEPLPKTSAKTTGAVPLSPLYQQRIQRRPIVPPVNYEAPTPVKAKKKSIADRIKEKTKSGKKAGMEALESITKPIKDRWGTTPEKEAEKEAERYEKERKDQLKKEEERRRARSMAKRQGRRSS